MQLDEDEIMGDRANCIVQQNAYDDLPPVYLYTHWGGSSLPQMVQRALQKRWRWGDDAYLTRIIFDTLSEGSQGTETGFGISTGPCDNGHPFVVVDPKRQEVRLESDPERKVLERWSFEDYCNAALSNIWEEVDA
jgi:hypothetical protein